MTTTPATPATTPPLGLIQWTDPDNVTADEMQAATDRYRAQLYDNPARAAAVDADICAGRAHADVCARIAAQMLRQAMPQAHTLTFGVALYHPEEANVNLLLARDADGSVIWHATRATGGRMAPEGHPGTSDTTALISAEFLAAWSPIEEALAMAYEANPLDAFPNPADVDVWHERTGDDFWYFYELRPAALLDTPAAVPPIFFTFVRDWCGDLGSIEPIVIVVQADPSAADMEADAQARAMTAAAHAYREVLEGGDGDDFADATYGVVTVRADLRGLTHDDPIFVPLPAV